MCHMQPEDGVTVGKETLLPSNFAASNTRHEKESSTETRKKSRKSSEEIEKKKDELPPAEPGIQVKEAALCEREAIEKKYPIGN